MGFLNGAYGKLMAGKLVRDLQYQMTGIQSQLRRVTRQVGDMEKMFTQQERIMKTQMQSQMMYATMGAMGGNFNALGMDANTAFQLFGNADTNKYATISQYVQQRFMAANTMWQNMFEMQREAMLQPLKDLEDDLQTQKDNLESRIKIAQAEYDAKKEEEKAGVKSLTPDYTGQS